MLANDSIYIHLMSSLQKEWDTWSEVAVWKSLSQLRYYNFSDKEEPIHELVILFRSKCRNKEELLRRCKSKEDPEFTFFCGHIIIITSQGQLSMKTSWWRKDLPRLKIQGKNHNVTGRRGGYTEWSHPGEAIQKQEDSHNCRDFLQEV